MNPTTSRTSFVHGCQASLLAASILFVLAPVLWAQSGSSSLSGLVPDATGGVMPGAKITVSNIENGLERVASVDVEGRYTFAQLPAGTYSLAAQSVGFADVVVEGVEVRVATNSTFNIVFESLQAVAETVTISADAVQLNTTVRGLFKSEVTL